MQNHGAYAFQHHLHAKQRRRKTPRVEIGFKARPVSVQRLNQRRVRVAFGIENRGGAIQHQPMKGFLLRLASDETTNPSVGCEGSLTVRAVLRQAFPQSKSAAKVCDAGVYINTDVQLFPGGGVPLRDFDTLVDTVA